MNNAIARNIFTALNNQPGRKIIEAYQNVLLRKQVAYSAHRSPFYRNKFAECSINPSRIRSASDLRGMGFFTTPKDLQADPFQFLATQREQIRYAMSSSGTTGAPKMVFFTRADWDVTVSVIYNTLVMMKITSKDVGQILFCSNTPTWMTGSLLQSSFNMLNALVLPTGNTDHPLKQIETMRQFGVTFLAGTPSYLHHLTEEGLKKFDLRKIGVRIIRLGAEPWSEDLRSHLQDAWGASVYDAYGMMEMGSAVAGECLAQDGMHVSPYFIVEVVNPATGESLPDGQTGELVLTTLSRQGSPLLRYRTGDLASKIEEKCCNCRQLPTERISRIIGRVDDMLFLGSGENLFPDQVERALLPVPDLVDFQMSIHKEQSQDRVMLRIETDRPSDEFRHIICQQLYNNLSFLHHDIYLSETIAPLEIEFLTPGTLMRENPIKLRRVIDRRPR
jgi:phenylacetate-CoA ligase